MPLTAEDVKNKQFTPTRFKGGYDEKEVDDFLDEVEAELTRLVRENTDLRARLQVAEQAARQSGGAAAASRGPCGSGIHRSAARCSAATAAAAGDGSAGRRRPRRPRHRRPLRCQRRSPATQARKRRYACSRWRRRPPKTPSPMPSAKPRRCSVKRGCTPINLRVRPSERHRNVVGNLDSERERLERKIEELRSFEREYRARLKSYLEGQLRDLDGRADGVQPTAPRPMPVPVGAGAPASAGASVSPPLSVSGSSVTVPPAYAPPQQPQPSSASSSAPAPGLAQPPRPPSPFSPVPSAGSPQSAGPTGPPRQATSGGFEVDEGPEVPPSNG